MEQRWKSHSQRALSLVSWEVDDGLLLILQDAEGDDDEDGRRDAGDTTREDESVLAILLPSSSTTGSILFHTKNHNFWGAHPPGSDMHNPGRFKGKGYIDKEI